MPFGHFWQDDGIIRTPCGRPLESQRMIRTALGHTRARVCARVLRARVRARVRARGMGAGALTGLRARLFSLGESASGSRAPPQSGHT